MQQSHLQWAKMQQLTAAVGLGIAVTATMYSGLRCSNHSYMGLGNRKSGMRYNTEKSDAAVTAPRYSGSSLEDLQCDHCQKRVANTPLRIRRQLQK